MLSRDPTRLRLGKGDGEDSQVTAGYPRQINDAARSVSRVCGHTCCALMLCHHACGIQSPGTRVLLHLLVGVNSAQTRVCTQ